jgi:perosamine synthetase
MTLAKEYDLKILEDAAQGAGLKFNNKHAGIFVDIRVLFCYDNKIITCDKDGIVFTNDDELAKKVNPDGY